MTTQWRRRGGWLTEPTSSLASAIPHYNRICGWKKKGRASATLPSVGFPWFRGFLIESPLPRGVRRYLKEKFHANPRNLCRNCQSIASFLGKWPSIAVWLMSGLFYKVRSRWQLLTKIAIEPLWSCDNVHADFIEPKSCVSAESAFVAFNLRKVPGKNGNISAFIPPFLYQSSHSLPNQLFLRGLWG